MKNRWLSLGLRIAVSAVLLIVLGMQAGISQLAEHFRSLTISTFLIVSVLFFIQISAGSERWRMILKGLSAPFPCMPIASVYSVALLANALIFNFIGGVVSKFILLRRLGAGTSVTVASIAIENLVTLLFLAITSFIGAPIALHLANLSFGIVALVAIGILAVSGFGVFILATARNFTWLYKYGGERLQNILERLRALLRNRWLVAKVFLLTALNQAAMYAAFVIIAVRLDLGFPVISFICILPAVSLLSALPISIGGWGVREGSVVMGLHFFDVPIDQALAASVLFGLLSICSAGLFASVVFITKPIWRNIHEQAPPADVNGPKI